MKQEEIANIETNIEVENSAIPLKRESTFQTIIVAFLRHKQLNAGADPRVEVESKKTKKTTIAIEEAMQGLIIYNEIAEIA